MKSTRRVVTVVALAALCLQCAAAQSGADSVRTRTVQILNADLSSLALVDGARVRTSEGNVRLQQDSTSLRADRVTEYLDRDQILFVGDVLIIDAGDTLRAEQVRYDTRTKTGRAEGDVRLSDGEVTVFAPAGRYFVDEKRTVFEEGVTLVDSATTLTSVGGVYFSEEERAEFFGDVRLEEPRTTLDADSVTYLRAVEVAEAHGDVRILRLGGDEAAADSLDRTFLFGAYAYNDERAGTSRVEGDPLLVRVQADTLGAVDTLVVRAVELVTTRRDTLQRLVAVGAVRVWQRDLAAVADSAVFDRIDGEPVREDVWLYRDPIAWFETTQVTGDTLHVVGRGGGVDTLRVPSAAFVAQEDTLTGRIHQLRGARLVGVFEADTLRTIDVGPDAEVIRYLRSDADEPDGAIQASAADRLLVQFRGGEVHRVSGRRDIDGFMYPEHLVPNDLALPGFRWLPDRRPSKAMLLPPGYLPVEPPEPPEVLEQDPS